jgi:alkanesulfonate monooxygenase SsuD/methylene tetrahydromethanopterin reductase-like flavin-dependent oxidoreductase (luciferase family)
VISRPAVPAQDLASLDVLSGGRLEIGIGAGWNRPEYDAIGLPFLPVGTRVAQLAEAVAVLKGCFADGPFSFAGEHSHDHRVRRRAQAGAAAWRRLCPWAMTSMAWCTCMVVFDKSRRRWL